MGLGHWHLPYSPVYAGFVGVGVWLSESKHRRRRRRVGYVHLRILASPAGPGGGRPICLVNTSAFLGFALTRMVGLLLGDVVLSRDEVTG